MSNSNLDILKRIKDEFSSLSSKSRALKIPSGINFIILDDTVEMKLSNKAVTSNMQKDDAAFESWALILKRWGKYKSIIISWEKPDSIDNGHYQRFLFRIKHFSQDFKSWFSIEKNCQILVDDLKIKTGGEYLVNIPAPERGDKPSENREAELENCFVKGALKEPLMRISNATFLERQLPVGVFKDKVLKSTSIFTGGKSAIDIWGFNDSNELLVFELKAEKNEKVGIVTELYFYVCVLRMIQSQIFKHENSKDENMLKIPKTKKNIAYFLCESLHPLIDKEILKFLNEANPKEINFHYIRFNEEYKLTLDDFEQRKSTTSNPKTQANKL